MKKVFSFLLFIAAVSYLPVSAQSLPVSAQKVDKVKFFEDESALNVNLEFDMKDLLANIATRGKPVADIEQGYISTATCILANLSMKLGRSIQWDHGKGVVVGDSEANQLLRRPYRAPWVHPEPGTV